MKLCSLSLHFSQLLNSRDPFKKRLQVLLTQNQQNKTITFMGNTCQVQLCRLSQKSKRKMLSKLPLVLKVQQSMKLHYSRTIRQKHLSKKRAARQSLRLARIALAEEKKKSKQMIYECKENSQGYDNMIYSIIKFKKLKQK